jgi:hypothetical protein
VDVAITVFDLDVYTHDDSWSMLLLGREVGCRERLDCVQRAVSKGLLDAYKSGKSAEGVAG